MSRSTRAGWLILATLVVGLGLWLAMLSSPRVSSVDEPAVAEPAVAPPQPAVAPPQPSAAPKPGHVQATAEARGKRPEGRIEAASSVQAADLPPASAVPVRQGPVEALEQRFSREPRDAAAARAEAAAALAFRDPEIPTGLLRSLQCVKTVCKAEIRWTEAHDQAYVLALTRAVGSFNAELGIAGAGEPDAAGVRALVVYWAHGN